MAGKKLWIFGIGVTVLCTVAVVATFWTHRTKPWNEQAIRAELFIPATSGDGQAKVCVYTALNLTE
jgi:hypothetical protein